MPSAKLKKSKRQRQLEERAKLEKERNRLRSELSIKAKQVSTTERRVEQVRTDANVELQRMSLEFQNTQDQVEAIREQAVHDLFRDMLASPAQISLLKLLTLSPDTQLRWLLPLTYYMRDYVRLALVGEKDQQVLLTEENCDAYVIQEPVSLPCQARIAKRGFAIGDTVIVRPEVTTLSEEH